MAEMGDVEVILYCKAMHSYGHFYILNIQNTLGLNMENPVAGKRVPGPVARTRLLRCL
jgi:hypothetical protein